LQNMGRGMGPFFFEVKRKLVPCAFIHSFIHFPTLSSFERAEQL